MLAALARLRSVVLCSAPLRKRELYSQPGQDGAFPEPLFIAWLTMPLGRFNVEYSRVTAMTFEMRGHCRLVGRASPRPPHDATQLFSPLYSEERAVLFEFT